MSDAERSEISSYSSQETAHFGDLSVDEESQVHQMPESKF
jgi:hypothetical protein